MIKGGKTMNTFLKWVAKKYVVSMANDLLDKYKEDVNGALNTLNMWIGRLERVLNTLRCIAAKLDDGKIDANEMEESIEHVSALVKEW